MNRVILYFFFVKGVVLNWPDEINTLMQDRNWSLRQLAARVEMSPSYLSDVMSGKAASPMLKLRILDMRGYDLASSAVLKMLLPKEVAEELVEKEKLRAHASLADTGGACDGGTTAQA